MEKIIPTCFRIAFTGPECSGKTTLALWLAQHLNLPFVAEYSRVFLSNKSTYSSQDVQHIGKEQFRLNQEKNQAVCDTEMTVVRIWENVKYGKISAEIEALSALESIDILFLCKPDIPWVYDPLRENPNDREMLYELYYHDLCARNRNFTVVEGELSQRKSRIIAEIEAFIL